MPRTLILAGSLAVLLPASLFAQTIESHAGIRLRFDAAGARGAAMGGTSEALTDAFAATTNPAALAKQRNRSASIELRHTDSSTDFETTDVTSTRDAIGGAMIVLPTRNATFAVYYDEPLAARMNPGALQLSIATSLRRLGAAAGWSHGNLSLGASLQYAQLERSLHFKDLLPGLTPIGTTDGGKLAWSTGAQWQITPALRAGASYRSGAKYEEQYSLNFAMPSSYAAGLAADLGPNLTITADAVRVRYSEALGYSEQFPNSNDYRFPDVTELHAGGEWRLATRVPVALRAGWWRDPAHRMRAIGLNLGLLDADENHITAGVGIGDRVKLDAAFDRSENTTRASLALATTF